MSTDSASPAVPAARFPLRGVQATRAGFAALAALMITFSPDHSATVGLAVFSGFAIATGLALALAAWLTFSSGRRAVPVWIAVLSIAAGMVASIPTWRSTTMFFVLVASWAILSGLIEAVSGFRSLRSARRAGTDRSEARDSATIGVITVLLGVVIPVIPAQYALDYYIADAGRSFTLTGITIAVGVFGAYAAIVAVLLGIAAFSPRPAVAQGAAEASLVDRVRPGDETARDREALRDHDPDLPPTTPDREAQR